MTSKNTSDRYNARWFDQVFDADAAKKAEAVEKLAREMLAANMVPPWRQIVGFLRQLPYK